MQQTPETAGSPERNTLPPLRLLRMGSKELELITSDKAAYQAFAEEERAKVSDPETGWEYFVNNYFSGVGPAGGARGPLELWPVQKEKLVPAIGQKEKLVILKTRRFGASLIFLHYFAWLGAYGPDTNLRLVAISNRLENSNKLLEQLKEIFDYINAEAPWLACPIGQDSRDANGRPGIDQSKELEIAHRGTSILSLPPNQAARSQTVSYLFLDEFARMESGSADPEKLLQAALPTIEGSPGNPGGRIAIVSSSGGRTGKGRAFAELYEAAEAEKNDFFPIFIGRNDKPGRTKDWFEQQVAVLGEATARTEFPSSVSEAFIGDISGLAFSPEQIDAVADLGAELRKERKAGRLDPKNGEVEIGLDWGYQGTGFVVKEDHARLMYFVSKSGEKNEADAETISREIVEEVEKPGYELYRVLYDPGGSGQQAHTSFRRLYGDRIRSYKVAFGKHKRRNVEFLRTLARRTLEQKDLPLEAKWGVLAIDPVAAKDLIQELRTVQLGPSGGLEKGSGEQHILDALIAAVTINRREFEAAYRDQLREEQASRGQEGPG